MDKFPRVKVKFVASMLLVKHSKKGIRSVTTMLAAMHLDKLKFKPEDRLLHVGCGAGDETAVIAAQVKSVTAVDFQSDVLEIARREHVLDNVDFLQDALGQASPNLAGWVNTFDKVVVLGRILYFLDGETTLKNAMSCLAPGGEILCVIPNKDNGFFSGAIKFLVEHPEWGEKMKQKKSKVTMWNKTADDAEAFFRSYCEWTSLAVELQESMLPFSEEKAKLYWLDSMDHVESADQSSQDERLDAVWQWAKNEFGTIDNGASLETMGEYVIISGVKA